MRSIIYLYMSWYESGVHTLHILCLYMYILRVDDLLCLRVLTYLKNIIKNMKWGKNNAQHLVCLQSSYPNMLFQCVWLLYKHCFTWDYKNGEPFSYVNEKDLLWLGAYFSIYNAFIENMRQVEMTSSFCMFAIVIFYFCCFNGST